MGRPAPLRVARALCCAPVFFALLALPAMGQDPSDTEESLRISFELERTLLEEDLADHQRVARRRGQLDDRIDRLRAALAAAMNDPQRSAAEIHTNLREIETAEGERSAAVEQERQILQRVLERRRKLEILSQRLEELGNRPAEGGALTGTWRLTMLPTDQRGTFFLRQVGTVVTGTYVLDGGFTGSLQGTLVDRKVALERIDSKLGRMMEFEGRLSSDGKMIRGRWQNRELAGGEGADGQWSAVRRERSR